MNRLYRRTMIGSTTILLLFVMAIGQTPDVGEFVVSIDVTRISVPSAVIWSEDFDDGNVSDWHMFAEDRTGGQLNIIPANFSLEGGVLRSIGAQ